MKANKKVLLAALIVCMTIGSSVFADWTDFIPTPYDNGAEIRGFGVYESDDNRLENRAFKWVDKFFREKFTFYSRGYAYDPRFLLYNFSISGIWRQEDYSSSFIPSVGYQNSSGVEYDVRVYILPEKPYHAEVFAFRVEPLFKQRSAVLLNNVETSKGALFRYRKKPYLIDTKYTDDTIERDINTTKIKTFSANANYFKEYENAKIFSVSAGFIPRSFSETTGLEGDSQEYTAQSLFRNRRLSLNSTLTKYNLDQNEPLSGSLSSDQLAFLELFSIHLPWNFRSDARYRYQKNSNTFENSGLEELISNTAQDVDVTVAHRLYESLDSRYDFIHNSTNSINGESSSTSHFGDVSYSKQTPYGFLQSGINLGTSRTDSIGEPSIVNEPHPQIRVPGSFVLNTPQGVSSNTIQVFLKSPLPPNELILLQQDVHYFLLPEGNTFRINVFSLPPEFAIPETYDFIVTYTLDTGTFALRTNSFGYRVSYDIYNTLMPYFRYMKTTQDLLSGFFLSALYNTNTQTSGVDFHKGGFRALAEYERFNWEIAPYNSWRFRADYSGSITDTLSLNANAEYINKYYPKGDLLQATEPFRDERSVFAASVQKGLFDRALLLSVGGGYTRFLGLVDGRVSSATASLIWKFAKLDFNVGATAYHSEIDPGTGFVQERTHQYYYFNIGRKLF